MVRLFVADCWLLAGLYVALSAVEVLAPAEVGQCWRGRAANVGFGVLVMLSGLAVTVLLYLLLPWRVRVHGEHGWVVSLLYLFGYLVATDFLFYWYHRLQHATRWVWWLHRLHHDEVQLNVTSSLRTFWLDRPVQVCVVSLPVQFVFGVDRRAAVLLMVVSGSWLCFTHANWRLRLGCLSSWLCGPQVHRVHHSRLAVHRDKNFAQFFPVLDRLFGTYFAPAMDEFPSTGLTDER